MAVALGVAACASPGGASARSTVGSADRAREGGVAPDGSTDATCRAGTFDVCLPEPEQGFLVRSPGATIAAGDDVEWCDVLAVPGDAGATAYVARIDGVMSPYSHHLHVLAVMPGSAADRASTVGRRGPCSENGRIPFGTGLRLLYSQDLFRGSRVFPPGFALPIPTGQKLLFDYHFINTSSRPVEASAVLSFGVLDASSVRREVGRFAMYRTPLDIPAGAAATFVTECRTRQDVEVLSLLRHTHALGTSFTAWIAGGPEDGQRIFESADWREHVLEPLEAPLRIRAGQGLRFRCDFENPTPRPVAEGTGAGDEMCVLYGDYASAVDGAPPPALDCVGPATAPGVVSVGAPCTDCPPGE